MRLACSTYPSTHSLCWLFTATYLSSRRPSGKGPCSWDPSSDWCPIALATEASNIFQKISAVKMWSWQLTECRHIGEKCKTVLNNLTRTCSLQLHLRRWCAGSVARASYTTALSSSIAAKSTETTPSTGSDSSGGCRRMVSSNVASEHCSARSEHNPNVLNVPNVPNKVMFQTIFRTMFSTMSNANNQHA